jgi:hypothetical protein
MDSLEHVRIIFVVCLRTENRSSRCHENSVLREARGHGSSIVLGPEAIIPLRKASGLGAITVNAPITMNQPAAEFGPGRIPKERPMQ